MAPRPLRAATATAATIALVSAGIAATSSAATADPDPYVDTTLCTDAPVPGGVQPVWTGPLVKGQEVHGLTTTEGVTPEGFTGTYVSRLADGAGPGKDILLFRIEGSRVTKTVGGEEVTDAGIWAGMSGSPVYDADDNLVGSISYGFSGAPSNLAGVTPAKDVLSIQSSPAAAPSAPARIGVSPRISRAVAASTTTRSDDAADHADIRRLRLPKVSVGTPGSVATRLAAKSRYLDKKRPGASLKFATASTTVDLDAATAIVPGGNIATAYAHGDVALASVGTVTAVCGSKVFAFGHPDEFDGNKATETYHAAEAAEIQEDTAFGSYKLANIDMEPVGQITQDRLSGILGITGQLPAETTITSSTTYPGGTRTAVTKVPVAAATGYAVSAQLFNDALVGLDAYVGGGEALMTWTIGYTPKGGAPATFTRTQRVTYGEYFAEQLGYEVSSDVEFLQYGSETKVAITSVDVTTQLEPDYDALRLSRVELRDSAGKWNRVKNGQRITARRGKTLPLRVVLVPNGQDSVATTVVQEIPTPVAKSASGSGTLVVEGGLLGVEDDEFTISFEDGDEEEYYDSEPLTLAEVLDALRSQPRNDTVLGTQQGNGRTTAQVFGTPAVTSGSSLIRLAYKK